MLSPLARREWGTILLAGVLLALAAFFFGLFWLIPVPLILAATLAAFYRDPFRQAPTQRHLMVSPADGHISSVHTIEGQELFDGAPARCIRTFLSVLDVHIVRSPCHARVGRILHRPGAYMNVLNPESAEQNEALTIELLHPTRHTPIGAIRLIAGMLARTICVDVREGQLLQRGERLGIFKLGSTTEVWIPESLLPQVRVKQGQKTRGAEDVLAELAGDQVITATPITTTQTAEAPPESKPDTAPEIAAEDRQPDENKNDLGENTAHPAATPSAEPEATPETEAVEQPAHTTPADEDEQGNLFGNL